MDTGLQLHTSRNKCVKPGASGYFAQFGLLWAWAWPGIAHQEMTDHMPDHSRRGSQSAQRPFAQDHIHRASHAYIQDRHPPPRSALLWAPQVQVIVKESRPGSCSRAAAALRSKHPLRRRGHQRLLGIPVEPVQLPQRPQERTAMHSCFFETCSMPPLPVEGCLHVCAKDAARQSSSASLQTQISLKRLIKCRQ